MSLPLRTVSGMRPTGPLHLGHYFGALKNWVTMQEEMECFYFVADWHALTSDYVDTSRVEEFSLEMVKDWLVAGLDPERSVIFQQALVKEHAELALILGMITPVSWLERNPTYKEQRQEITHKDLGNVGFLSYPVLMSADILMYKPKWVPVGEDQLPHLELTREICRRFNNLYGDFFIEPEARLTVSARCPGLDGRKMSKSYNNAIYLKDSMEEITPKIKGMFTDKNRLRRTDPGDPEICNLYPYHELLTDEQTRAEICEGCVKATWGCVDCKKVLLGNLEKFLTPLHERRRELEQDPGYISDVLRDGTNTAREEAQKIMTEANERIGFSYKFAK
jgi:tryptophanyl-tRNA synthetase